MFYLIKDNIVRQDYNSTSSMDGNFIYWSLVKLINSLYWGGELILEGELPTDRPAVFVANHIGPEGPIGVLCTIPLRLYPWVISDMMDSMLAGDYLRFDFIEPSLHLKQPISGQVAAGLSRISVPLLKKVGCIPVFHDFSGLQNTLQISLELLLSGRHLLVFPEDTDLPPDPKYNMMPFRKGVTRLGEMYYQQTGQSLAFYPVCVHRSRQVRVGEPVYFSPHNPKSIERLRIRNYLEGAVHQLYLESESR